MPGTGGGHPDPTTPTPTTDAPHNNYANNGTTTHTQPVGYVGAWHNPATRGRQTTTHHQTSTRSCCPHTAPATPGVEPNNDGTNHDDAYKPLFYAKTVHEVMHRVIHRVDGGHLSTGLRGFIAPHHKAYVRFRPVYAQVCPQVGFSTGLVFHNNHNNSMHKLCIVCA
jgi:hypothetical protein